MQAIGSLNHGGCSSTALFYSVIESSGGPCRLRHIVLFWGNLRPWPWRCEMNASHKTARDQTEKASSLAPTVTVALPVPRPTQAQTGCDSAARWRPGVPAGGPGAPSPSHRLPPRRRPPASGRCSTNCTHWHSAARRPGAWTPSHKLRASDDDHRRQQCQPEPGVRYRPSVTPHTGHHESDSDSDGNLNSRSGPFKLGGFRVIDLNLIFKFATR